MHADPSHHCPGAGRIIFSGIMQTSDSTGLMSVSKLTSYTLGLLLQSKLEGHENKVNEFKKM